MDNSNISPQSPIQNQTTPANLFPFWAVIIIVILLVFNIALVGFVFYERNRVLTELEEITEDKVLTESQQKILEVLEKSLSSREKSLLNAMPEDIEVARMKARDGRRVADIKQIQLALELYYDAHSSYPSTSTWEEEIEGSGFVAKVPKDPVTGESYIYCRLSGDTYHLGVKLEDTSARYLENDEDYVSNCLNGVDPVYDVKPSW